MSEHEPVTALILKDVIDGIEQFYGKDGVWQVVNFALARNRSRESNKLMDELEAAFGPFPEAAGSPPPFQQCEQCWQPATCKKYGCCTPPHPDQVD